MDREAIWAMYFAGIVSMREHPGNRTHERTFRSITDCAALADSMMDEHAKRWGEDHEWPGSQP